MAQSNASRGNLFQDEIWISGRPVIKIFAGHSWGVNLVVLIWIGYVYVGQGDIHNCERKYA